jgi:hypothetical protein
MRWTGILGIVAMLASASANAQDATRTCLALLDPLDRSQKRDEQPLLTKNSCEAMEREELRAPLMEITQEDEDPIELSFGVKNTGGTLRLKIPFSF